MKKFMTLKLTALTGAALLAGCGGGGNEPAAAPAGSGSVEEQLGFGRVDSPEAQAKAENEIAACMRAQGFEYVPVDPVAAQAALTGKSNLSGDDFDKQFGYGIATLYGRGTPQSDPNGRIRQNLSAADLRAYNMALSGGQPEQTFARAADTGDFSQLGGCTKEAADKLFGGSELLTTVQRKLDEFDEAVLQDQRMVRAFDAWRACVRDKTGQTFEDSEGVELEIQRRLAEIVGPLPAGESAPGEFANHTSEQPYNPAALAALRRLELEFAAADVACEDQHIADVEEAVQAEKQKAFVEANAELLRRVRGGG